MKQFLCVFLLIQALTAQAQSRSPRSLIEAWEKSWNTYDLDVVRHLFVNDSSVTYFSSERAGLIHGIDSLVKHHQSFGFVPGGKSSPNKLWLTDVQYIQAHHGRPFVAATWHFQRPGNPEQRGAVTFVLKYSPDWCWIAHAHFSNDPKPK